MIRPDLITSIILMVLGLATAMESWRMPRFTEVGSSIWTAPGIVPGLLGLALTILAFILFWRTMAARRAGAVDQAPGEPGAWRRIATVLGLCLIYAGVLVGNLPFWLATFLFTFAFIVIFELAETDARERWGRHVVSALIIAGLTSGVISYIFQKILFVRLP